MRTQRKRENYISKFKRVTVYHAPTAGPRLEMAADNDNKKPLPEVDDVKKFIITDRLEYLAGYNVELAGFMGEVAKYIQFLANSKTPPPMDKIEKVVEAISMTAADLYRSTEDTKRILSENK